jgi:hypothetical protein
VSGNGEKSKGLDTSVSGGKRSTNTQNNWSRGVNESLYSNTGDCITRRTRMIALKDLQKLAKARLADSELLYSQQRYDAAAYLCGYVVELALKARICKTLKWEGFPETNKEFQGFQCLKTHDLGILLEFSGREQIITTCCSREWSIISLWNPEDRYQLFGASSKDLARDRLDAVKVLLKSIK